MIELAFRNKTHITKSEELVNAREEDNKDGGEYPCPDR